MRKWNQIINLSLLKIKQCFVISSKNTSGVITRECAFPADDENCMSDSAILDNLQIVNRITRSVETLKLTPAIPSANTNHYFIRAATLALVTEQGPPLQFQVKESAINHSESFSFLITVIKDFSLKPVPLSRSSVLRRSRVHSSGSKG